MQTVEQRVSQRARDAAHDLRRKQGERIMRAVRDKAAASVLGDDEGDDALDIQAFARFEASLPPSAPVGRDAVERMRAVAEGGTINGTYKMPPFASLQVFRGDLLDLIAALALPPSGIAEMVREMCAGVVDQNAASCRREVDSLLPGPERMAWARAAEEIDMAASAIRRVDLSSLGVSPLAALDRDAVTRLTSKFAQAADFTEERDRQIYDALIAYSKGVG